MAKGALRREINTGELDGPRLESKVDANEETGRVKDDILQVTLSNHAGECFEMRLKTSLFPRLKNAVETQWATFLCDWLSENRHER